MISYHKLYSVFSKNIPRKFVRLLSKGLKVQAKEKLGTYLGCPRDVDGRNLNVFQGIHQKVNTTITSWKFNNLNQAGKLILINSILAVYTFHIMTTFLFPRKVLKSVTSSLLRFWRVSSKDRKPIYWEKISFLEEHKNCGGWVWETWKTWIRQPYSNNIGAFIVIETFWLVLSLEKSTQSSGSKRVWKERFHKEVLGVGEASWKVCNKWRKV